MSKVTMFGSPMTESLSLRQFLPYRCNNLAQRISVSLSRIYVERFGVSIAEWRLLATLAEGEELQAKQIGQRTNMDKVRVSRAVASLVRKGLLNKRTCDEDSRASRLSLSAHGSRLYQRIVPEALAWEKSLVQPLSQSEQQSLFQIIEKLEGRLNEIERGPA